MGFLSMTVKYIAQRSCGSFLSGIVESQVGWGFEKPDLVEGVPYLHHQWKIPSLTPTALSQGRSLGLKTTQSGTAKAGGHSVVLLRPVNKAWSASVLWEITAHSAETSVILAAPIQILKGLEPGKQDRAVVWVGKRSPQQCWVLQNSAWPSLRKSEWY